MFIALVSFMNGLNEMLDGLMLNRTPHILLYNEVKPSENQPLGLSEDYKRNANFIRSNQKTEGNQYTTVCRLLRPKAGQTYYRCRGKSDCFCFI
jgi:ABC-type lipoprotein release transport system permease subunit